MLHTKQERTVSELWNITSTLNSIIVLNIHDTDLTSQLEEVRNTVLSLIKRVAKVPRD